MKFTSLGAAGDLTSISPSAVDAVIASPSGTIQSARAQEKQHVLGVDFSRRQLPKPEGGPIAFLPGEELGRMHKPESHDARQWIGEVAATLGECLQDRYDWDRPVAIDSKAVISLLKSPGLQGKRNVQWKLKADRNAESVLLVAWSDGKPVAHASVFDLRQVPAGMVILRLDPNDLEETQRRLTRRYNAGGHTEGCLSVPAHLKHHAGAARPLHGLDPHSRIMLVGHSDNAPSRGPGLPYATNKLADLGPGQLAERLVKLGLNKGFCGTLYLESCGSASGFANGSSFAHALQAELFERGYRKASVAGLPGDTIADAAGHNISHVDALSTDIEIAAKQSRGIAKNLKAAREQHSAALALALGAVDGARKPQDDTTRALTRALHSEQAHLGVLKRLQRLVKRSPAQGADADQRKMQILESSGVLNWWGRLGPGSSRPKPPTAPKK